MRPAGVSPQLQRGVSGVGRRAWTLLRPRLGSVMICHPSMGAASLTCQACNRILQSSTPQWRSDIHPQTHTQRTDKIETNRKQSMPLPRLFPSQGPWN